MQWPTLPLLIILLCWGGAAAARHDSDPQPQTLAAQLELMAAEQGFELSGLEQIDPAAPAVVVADTDATDKADESDEAEKSIVAQHFKSLLRGYDHVIIHASKERIGRLMILGEKRPAPPPPPPPPPPSDDENKGDGKENVVPTQRRGEHHLVTATLRGVTSGAMEMELMVDTGASLVVLPSSAATQLGLEPEKLESREMQTAKGKAQARIGRLGSIELGSTRLSDIEVAFVDGEQLGENGLLGMNVLGRYIFILDDENNQLTLIPEGK